MYIDTHLDGALDVDISSRVAHLSKCHFYRQFSIFYGMGVSAYVKKLRLKRASFQLLFWRDQKIINIAFNCGYENSKSFSRAFRQVVGQSPSQFRKEPNWIPWQKEIELVAALSGKNMAVQAQNIEVRVVEFASIPVTLMPHRGAPDTLDNTLQEFIACASTKTPVFFFSNDVAVKI
ncbi:MAG: AraC family transcriptional regulator [Lentisphaeria bacterium]|jgi:AraC family transcriptional regulator